MECQPQIKEIFLPIWLDFWCGRAYDVPMIKNEPNPPMTDEEFWAIQEVLEDRHGPDEVEDTSWAVDLPAPTRTPNTGVLVLPTWEKSIRNDIG